MYPNGCSFMKWLILSDISSATVRVVAVTVGFLKFSVIELSVLSTRAVHTRLRKKFPATRKTAAVKKRLRLHMVEVIQKTHTHMSYGVL